MRDFGETAANRPTDNRRHAASGVSAKGRYIRRSPAGQTDGGNLRQPTKKCLCCFRFIFCVFAADLCVCGRAVLCIFNRFLPEQILPSGRFACDFRVGFWLLKSSQAFFSKTGGGHCRAEKAEDFFRTGSAAADSRSRLAYANRKPFEKSPAAKTGQGRERTPNVPFPHATAAIHCQYSMSFPTFQVGI